MQSSVDCNVIAHPKGMKFFQVGWSGTGFRLSRKPLPSVKTCNLIKTKFDYGISNPPYDIRLGVVINCAKLDVCTPSSFGGVTTDRWKYAL